MKKQVSTHPSRWTIQRDPTSRQKMILPDHYGIPVVVSTHALHACLRAWDSDSTLIPRYAGDLANILRELRAHKIDLLELRGVRGGVPEQIYGWLDAYECALTKFKHASNATDTADPTPIMSNDMRDSFAKAAMAALITTSDGSMFATPEVVAAKAYEYADAMVAARKQQQ